MTKNVTSVSIRGSVETVTVLRILSGLQSRPRLVAVGLTLFVFAPVLLFGRVRYDDHWLWADDSPLRHLSLATLRDIFFELEAQARRVYGTEYLPIRDLAVATDMAIWGDNETGPHAANLALYAVTVAGLGALLVRFGFKPALAWLGTIIWALHPIHVESVAWLSERKGILAGLFFVVCGHAWVRFRSGRSRWWLVAASLAAVAAVWSKAPAIFGVALLACWDLLLLPSHRRRWVITTIVGVATALAAVPVVLVAIDGRIVTQTTVHDLGRVEAALGALGHYIESLLLLRAPSISYPVGTDGPGGVEIALGLGSVVVSLAMFVWWWHKRDSKYWLAVVVWGWVWFAPVSHLIMPVHIYVADRFAYLWSLAGCLVIAGLVLRLRAPWRTAIAGVVLCLLAVATIRAQNSWTNSVELFSRAFAANPRDPKACENLAMALVDDGRPSEALVVVARGLDHRPGNPHLLSRKSRILDALDRRDEALEASQAAAWTHYASAMWNHAVLLRAAGRRNEALAWAALAARRHPHIEHYVEIYLILLAETGHAAYARGYVEALNIRDPSSPLVMRMRQALGF